MQSFEDIRATGEPQSLDELSETQRHEYISMKKVLCLGRECRVCAKYFRLCYTLASEQPNHARDHVDYQTEPQTQQDCFEIELVVYNMLRKHGYLLHITEKHFSEKGGICRIDRLCGNRC